MQLPRRNFLKTGTLGAVSAGLAFSSVNSVLAQRSILNEDGTSEIPLKSQESQLLRFTRGTFAPYVGDIFQVPNARGEMISLILTNVATYKMNPNTRLSTKTPKTPNGFSLTFTSTEGLPQFTSIHKISHPALGEFDLFLVPNKKDDGTFVHVAIFNHTN